MKYFFVAATAIACVGAAHADAVQPDEQADKPLVQDEVRTTTPREHNDQVTCKTKRVLGSRIAREKICMTNAQWKSRAQEASRSLRSVSMGQQGCSKG